MAREGPEDRDRLGCESASLILPIGEGGGAVLISGRAPRRDAVNGGPEIGVEADVAIKRKGGRARGFDRIAGMLLVSEDQVKGATTPLSAGS